MPSNVAKRANRILEIAQRMASKHTDFQVSNVVDNICLYSGYAEPGYTVGKAGLIATGNWNTITKWDDDKGESVDVSNLPERIGNLFEKMGIDCEWCDEWFSCDVCGKLVRTEPDCFSWKPSYRLDSNGFVCHECIKEEADESDEEEDE